jgi:hypothetical protein
MSHWTDDGRDGAALALDHLVLRVGSVAGTVRRWRVWIEAAPIVRDVAEMTDGPALVGVRRVRGREPGHVIVHPVTVEGSKRRAMAYVVASAVDLLERTRAALAGAL